MERAYAVLLDGAGRLVVIVWVQGLGSLSPFFFLFFSSFFFFSPSFFFFIFHKIKMEETYEFYMSEIHSLSDASKV